MRLASLHNRFANIQLLPDVGVSESCSANILYRLCVAGPGYRMTIWFVFAVISLKTQLDTSAKHCNRLHIGTLLMFTQWGKKYSISLCVKLFNDEMSYLLQVPFWVTREWHPPRLSEQILIFKFQNYVKTHTKLNQLTKYMTTS